MVLLKYRLIMASMTFIAKKPRGSGPQRCRFISEQHLSLFIDFIEASPDMDADGDTLRRLATAFQEQQKMMAPIYRRSFDDCHRARKQREFDDKRNDHLGRLLVRLISDHFVENGGKPLEEGGLSRRIVPGLLSVLELALGADVLTEYRQTGQDIVDRVLEATGDEFEWEDYFDDGEAQMLLAKVLIDLAVSFDDYEKRRDWVLQVINTALQHEQVADGEVENWAFEEIHFQGLVEALFRPIMAATVDADKRIAFATAFGQAQLDSISDFLESAGFS